MDTKMPIQDNSEVLDIVLNPANGVDWIVGIKARVDGENAISVGDGSRGILYQMATGERTGPAKIVAHAPDPLQPLGSSVSISRGTSDHILVAYLEVMNPRALTIHEGAELVSLVHVKDGVVIGKRYGGPKVADWTLRTRTIGHVVRRQAGLAVSSS